MPNVDLNLAELALVCNALKQWADKLDPSDDAEREIALVLSLLHCKLFKAFSDHLESDRLLRDAFDLEKP